MWLPGYNWRLLTLIMSGAEPPKNGFAEQKTVLRNQKTSVFLRKRSFLLKENRSFAKTDSGHDDHRTETSEDKTRDS